MATHYSLISNSLFHLKLSPLMAHTRALSPLMADPSHSWRPMAKPHGWRPKDLWPKPMPIISFSFSLFSHLSSQTWALSLLSWPIHLMAEPHGRNPKTHGWRPKDPWPKSHHLSLWLGSFRGNKIWNWWGLACVLVFLVLCFDIFGLCFGIFGFVFLIWTWFGFC